MLIKTNPKWEIGDLVYIKTDGAVKLRVISRWRVLAEVRQEPEKPLMTFIVIEYEVTDPVKSGENTEAVNEPELFAATVEGFAEASGQSGKIQVGKLSFLETIKAWWEWAFPETTIHDEDDRDR